MNFSLCQHSQNNRRQIKRTATQRKIKQTGLSVAIRLEEGTKVFGKGAGTCHPGLTTGSCITTTATGWRHGKQRQWIGFRMQSGPWEKPELIIRTAISKEKGQGQKVCGKYEHLRVLTWTNSMTMCSGRRHLLKVNLPYLESQQGETAINREMWQPIKRQTNKRTNSRVFTTDQNANSKRSGRKWNYTHAETGLFGAALRPCLSFVCKPIFPAGELTRAAVISSSAPLTA